MKTRNRDGSSDRLGTAGEPNHLYTTESQDCEDPREYRYVLDVITAGGYRPVQIGDSLNRRYQVVSKLGWGFFSTVWLCRSGWRVALKVLKSSTGFSQAGLDEQPLLRYLSSASSLFLLSSSPVSRHPSSQRIVQLLDEFKLAGVNRVAWDDETCAWFWSCWGPASGPGSSVLGIQALCSLGSSKYSPRFSRVWTTFTLDYKHFSEEIQTRQYRYLEVLLRSEYGPPADLGGVACMALELLTGDSLFHPKAGEFMSLEEDHIGQIVELLGRIPPDVVQSVKHSAQYFDRRGDLRRVGPLRPWRLYDLLVEKYNFLLEEASEFSNFLLCMLDYHSERRATAAFNTHG